MRLPFASANTIFTPERFPMLEEILIAGLEELGLACDETALARFRRYYETLEE